MKNTPAILLLFALLSCTANAPRSGDLLFVGLPAGYNSDSSSMSSGITEATGGGSVNYIHTAILEAEGDSLWVIDATIRRGVARYPLDTFLRDFTLRDGSLPVLEVMRLKDGPKGMVENAKKFIGQPYDEHFLPDNGAAYCTELVRDSYLDEAGSPIFPAAPMNFKGPDGEFPAYWQRLFGSFGEPIPQGVPGTNPQDMHNYPLLRKVKVRLF